MKRKLFLVVSIFTPAVLAAQITISSTDLANAGDSVLVYKSSPVGIAVPLNAGPNFNMDYSTLTSTGQGYEKFDAPSSYPSVYSILVFITTYGKNNNLFTSFPNSPITAAYDFFKKTSSSLKQVGSGYIVNAAPIPFIYTQQDVVYKFPMDYLNTDSCDFKFGLQIPTFGYYGQTGHRVNEVDGWGTLITPAGTFQTLRIKSTISTIDTIYYTGSPFGGITMPGLKYEYKWFATGEKMPVLEIDATKVLGNITISNIQYTNYLRIGIEENKGDVFNMNVYPNPVVDEIALKYTLPSATRVHLSITDETGKNCTVISDENQRGGVHQKSISIKDLQLSPGIYFLNLEATDYCETRKIIITK